MMKALIISVTLLFVGIGFLVLIHVCIVGRAFRRRFNSDNMVERRNYRRSKSMSHDDLEKLPCFVFEAEEKGSSSSVDCAVCLEDFKMGEKCRLLPACKHSFHAQCVDSWLLISPICPICRTSADSPLKGNPENSHSGEVGFELGEIEQVVAGTRINSHSSPLQNSSSELSV